jgi:hypothetical protein
MNCRAAQNQLAAYLADQLSSDENRAVAQHLAGCVDCRAQLARLAQVEDQLRASFQNQFARLAPPAGAWARLETAAMRRPSPSGLVVAPRLIGLSLLAALLLVGLLAPSAFAQMAEAVGHWFHVQVPNTTTQVRVADFQAFTPFAPAYLPPGFDLTVTGVNTAPGQDEFRLVYQHAGDTILLLQYAAQGSLTSMTGVPVVLNTTTGVLAADLSAFRSSDLALFTASLPNILVWDQAGVRLELFANLPVADLARMANAMQPASP